jgi:hypothetical protein
MIATAVVAAVGDGHMFAGGRDMAAWLGLVSGDLNRTGLPMSRNSDGFLRRTSVGTGRRAASAASPA